MDGRGFAIILVIYVVLVTGKRPVKKCPRKGAYADCMEGGDRTLWCDMSNYASLNEISTSGIDLSAIVTLYLNDSCLRDLHAGSKLQHFPDLTSLKLDDNFIREIPEHTFAGNPNLQKVDLSTNNIKSIHRRPFRGLRKLRILSIDNNEIIYLRGDWLHDLTALRNLSLSRNGVRHLRRGHLHTLRSLTSLNLKDNLISAIEARTFHGLSELQELHLDGNLLTDIETGTFDGLRSLQVLTLSSNKISSWSMVQSPSLHHIGQAAKDLSVLSDVFGTLCNLGYVNLRNNNLTYLNPNWLRERGNRDFVIDLRQNPWECRCEALEFKKELNMNRNNIQVTEIVCQTPKYAKKRNLLDQDLVEEIEFRTKCNSDASTSKTPSTVTRCNSTTDDIPMRKFTLHGILQSIDQDIDDARLPVFTPTKLPSAPGFADALVLLTTEGNGSYSMHPSACRYLPIFITTVYKLINLFQ